MMKNTYWSGDGKYQTQFEKFSKELMPASGNCDTVAGEFIRAANKLYWDFYNNGMGNNTSGALNFLERYGVVDASTYYTIKPYTRGRVYNSEYNGDAFQKNMEHMVSSVVEFIMKEPELTTKPNTQDMFDFQEPFEDEDDEY